jgi:CheY-like chemotaxis protein
MGWFMGFSLLVPSDGSGHGRRVPAGPELGSLMRDNPTHGTSSNTKGDDMGKNGHRLTFLVVEVEPGQALSTRKLLLETAKHNVMTAHSGKEGVEMLRRFPKVDAIALDVGLKDMECSRIAKEMKSITPRIPIVAMSPRVADQCEWADKIVSSHEPRELVELLENLGTATAARQPIELIREGSRGPTR